MTITPTSWNGFNGIVNKTGLIYKYYDYTKIYTINRYDDTEISLNNYCINCISNKIVEFGLFL